VKTSSSRHRVRSQSYSIVARHYCYKAVLPVRVAIYGVSQKGSCMARRCYGLLRLTGEHQVVRTLWLALRLVLDKRKIPKETVHRHHRRRCRSDRDYAFSYKARLREASRQRGRTQNGPRRSHKLVRRKASHPRRQESTPSAADAPPAHDVRGSDDQPSQSSGGSKRSLARLLTTILAAFMASRA
jgi:hypothetical protein